MAVPVRGLPMQLQSADALNAAFYQPVRSFERYH